MRPKEPEDNDNLEALLEEAENLLNKDIDNDIEELEKNSNSPMVNFDKYEKAKELFEKALEIDPQNERANYGFNACTQMLIPYHPVQYMMDVSADLKIDLITTIDGVEKNKPAVEKKKPWEILADWRARDDAGIRYTQKAFGEASAKAEKEVLEIIARAKQQLESGEKQPAVIYDETLKEIEELQERLHRGWKGHGPEVLEMGLIELKRLGLEKRN
ncbi:MAG: hypothetical protein ACFFCS_15605 [Candidatus Hodarchaeota archaeon]